MPAFPSPRSPEPRDSAAGRVMLFGGAPRTLDLLRLAVICSDNILLLMAAAPPAVRAVADAYAVEVTEALRPADLFCARTVLIAMDDTAMEDTIARQARAMGLPVHVADRPAASDFTLLDLLEQRPSSFRPIRP